MWIVQFKSLGVSWNWNGSACERLHSEFPGYAGFFTLISKLPHIRLKILAHNPQFQGNKQCLFLHLITLKFMWKEESHTCPQTLVCT